MDKLVQQYAESHQHPFNRLCHTIGIPMIVLSLGLGACAIWVRREIWPVCRHFRCLVVLPRDFHWACNW